MSVESFSSISRSRIPASKVFLKASSSNNRRVDLVVAGSGSPPLKPRPVTPIEDELDMVDGRNCSLDGQLDDELNAFSLNDSADSSELENMNIEGVKKDTAVAATPCRPLARTSLR